MQRGKAASGLEVDLKFIVLVKLFIMGSFGLIEKSQREYRQAHGP